MAFHVYWPAMACVTLFVVGVIMVLLRYGPRYCKVRHTALPDTNAEWSDQTYEQRVSYA